MGRIRRAHARTRPLRLLRRVVILIVLTSLRPDPCCETSNGDRTSHYERDPVAEDGVLSAGGWRCVEGSAGAIRSASIVGHAGRLHVWSTRSRYCQTECRGMSGELIVARVDSALGWRRCGWNWSWGSELVRIGESARVACGCVTFRRQSLKRRH